jgi:hypothetical protein
MVCLFTGSRPSLTFNPLSGISYFTQERVAQSLWKVWFPTSGLLPLQMLRNNLRLFKRSSPTLAVQEPPLPEDSPPLPHYLHSGQPPSPYFHFEEIRGLYTVDLSAVTVVGGDPSGTLERYNDILFK